MQNLFPVIFWLAVIVIIGVLQLLFFRFLNPEWWRKRWVRRGSWTLPLVGVASVALWGYGEYTARDWLIYPGAIIAVPAAILEMSLILSLPLSGIIHLVNRLFDRLPSGKETRQGRDLARSRRVFLRRAAAAVPLAALAAGGAGVVSALSRARVYRKTIFIEQLPAGLESLRILHLSDSHLHHYVTLDDLAEVLERALTLRPDLVLVTGDIADNLDLLPDALSLIAATGVPLGVFACLGNHEYFRGIGRVRKTFEKATVPLLVNDGLHLSKGGSSLFIGGLDDPRFHAGADPQFFRDGLAATVAPRQAGSFMILMSHRPGALDSAAEHGVDLILAGHTHGGQIGFGNRSLFESPRRGWYLWGHYRKGSSHLYTTSGLGHWFPLRLGCPTEAPVIELRRGKPSAADG
ncbi:MAG: metallophosphoesterase [Candidatus Zixiibacteriota bacterium]|nr:MAG: metallophosphoesterase [candidate division Zixibacteria bacterium]